MKALKFIFLIVTCFGLILSCSKDEVLLEDEGDLFLKKASMAPTFVVEPNGVDDTENLKNAFADAMAAGPNAVVQLVEGEYHLGFIEIRDFFGSFKGAGKGKTIITAMNNLDAQSLMDQNLSPDLMKFIGGNVTLSDFTIRTPAGGLTVSGLPFIRCLINFSATNANYEWDNPDRCINAVVDNVCFKGHIWEDSPIGYFNKYNCYFGLRTGWDFYGGSDIPREKINLKLTNSQIENFVYGLVLEGVKESEMIIGEKNKGNLICNNDQGGGIWEFRDTKINLVGNTFMVPPNAWGIDLDNRPWYSALRQEPQSRASIFTIEKNVFKMDHSSYSMFCFDYRQVLVPEEPNVLFIIKNNRFDFEGGNSVGVYCRRTKDMVLRNNKFSGDGYVGIWVFTNKPTVFNENGLILGNNFSNGVFAASVYFYSTTRDWTVVGGNLGETMLDLGENNLINGFNNMDSDVPFGQTIVDNLEEIRGPLYDLKGN